MGVRVRGTKRGKVLNGLESEGSLQASLGLACITQRKRPVMAPSRMVPVMKTVMYPSKM